MAEELFTPEDGSFGMKGTETILNIIFVVDISGSMRFHGRIEAVNDAFTRMIPALRQVQMGSSEFELRIAIMTFDQHARWIVNPTPIMEYNHNDIVCSEWVTYYSRAFSALDEKLSRAEFMAHKGKIAAPYIMFLTDGAPSADDNYGPALDELLKNAWFTNSQRFAVLIGKDAIESAEARNADSRFVTSPEEGIINAADAEDIAAEVQAKTLHTINIMTKHTPPIDDDNNNGNDNNNGSNGGGNGSGGFGGLGDFKEGIFV